MRLLFWNIQKKDAPPELSAFCQAKSVDIVLLAEPGRQAKHLGDTLTVSGTAEYVRQVQRTELFEVCSRHATHQMLSKHDSNRFSIWNIKPNVGADFILVVLHLQSKMHAKRSDQHASAQLVVTELQRVERELGHQRSLIIGDFNMHPFDEGMVAANAFHGVMDRQIAREKTRTVAGLAYDFLYNPMWSRLGDASNGPCGTHSYRESGITAYFWHTFDQVLLRPALMDRVPDQNIQVLDSLGTLSLLGKSGKISGCSDHLPLLVELND